jgi:YHS domain-containing protein
VPSAEICGERVWLMLTAACVSTGNISSHFRITLIGGNPAMPIDPVCKMEVSIAEAAASHDYGPETLYFCSMDCLREFERDPATYMDDMDDEERVAS